MAKEAREIIAYQEQQLSGRKDKTRDFKLGALHLVRVAVDYAEKIGALPASLPQFSRATELTQARTHPTETLVTDKERLMADLGLTHEQVAGHPYEVNENTKAYLGSLINYDDKHRIIPILKQIGHLDYIYSDYPEEQIEVFNMTRGGVPKEKLPQFVKDKDSQVTANAKNMIRNKAFTTDEGEPQPIRLFKASVGTLGFRDVTTTSDLYARIEALGGDLCPDDVGPHRRVQYTHQPMNDVEWIAMKQITDSYGSLSVFVLARRRGGPWLGGHLADPGRRWDPRSRVVFSLRK